MDVKIKYSKLFSTFEKMMTEFNNLDFEHKTYDYYNYEKGRYSDLDTLNFYRNLENDYESDNWVLQYQQFPGDIGKNEDLPILRYPPGYLFRTEETMFNHHFEDLLKNWFEKTYNLKVKTIEKY